MVGIDFSNWGTNIVLLAGLVLILAIYAVIEGISRILFFKRLRELEVAMVRFPNYADVRAQIGALYYSHGYLDKAKNYYYEALKIYNYYH